MYLQWFKLHCSSVCTQCIQTILMLIVHSNTPHSPPLLDLRQPCLSTAHTPWRHRWCHLVMNNIVTITLSGWNWAMAGLSEQVRLLSCDFALRCNCTFPIILSQQMPLLLPATCWLLHLFPHPDWALAMLPPTLPPPTLPLSIGLTIIWVLPMGLAWPTQIAVVIAWMKGTKA